VFKMLTERVGDRLYGIQHLILTGIHFLVRLKDSRGKRALRGNTFEQDSNP
jgi:hypothetical protein